MIPHIGGFFQSYLQFSFIFLFFPSELAFLPIFDRNNHKEDSFMSGNRNGLSQFLQTFIGCFADWRINVKWLPYHGPSKKTTS